MNTARNPGRLRLWWWRLRHQTERYVWRRPEKSDLAFRAVLIRVKEVREPFGEWTEVERSAEGFNSVSMAQWKWDQIREHGYAIAD